MTEKKNFSGQTTPSIVDTEYHDCNFSQKDPVDSGGGVFVGVRIFPGDDTPRKFVDCNLSNAEPPPGSTLVKCNTTLIQRRFVYATEDIVVDGVTVGTVESKEHRIHGRWTPAGYVYPAMIKVQKSI